MKLVIGLGNPGARYARTRHNIGARVADEFVSRAGETWQVHKKSGAEVADLRIGDHRVLIAKPRTYMNEAGRQVGPLAAFYSLAPADLIVLHDELDIDFGAIRLKRGGGEGGHNGLRSISSALGSKDYSRVRLGIGRPPGRQDPADFVLKAFSTGEREGAALLVENGIDATELLITAGLEAAQNQAHAW